MRKPNTMLAAAVAASFLAQSCFSVQRVPVPEPDFHGDFDVRGVVLGEGPDSETFEFSDVMDARWTETSLTITGVVHAPGEADHGRTSSVSFPLSEVSEVLVSEFDGTRASVIVMAVLVGVSAAVMFIVTGKSKAGVPIGSSDQ